MWSFISIKHHARSQHEADLSEVLLMRKSCVDYMQLYYDIACQRVNVQNLATLPQCEDLRVRTSVLSSTILEQVIGEMVLLDHGAYKSVWLL